MRLDSLLFEKCLFPSRTKAAEFISSGKVLYRGKAVKPSINVENLDFVEILTEEESFVSNGGYKLKKALDEFGFDATGMVFADVGASNGGFTDCLIKRGAKKVFAIDVGESQLDKSLLTEKVVVLDNTNARFMTSETLGEKVDGVTCDVSFISLTYVLQGIKNILKDGGVAFLLIKPQFECGKEFLGNSGIVKSVLARKNAVKKVYNALIELELYPLNLTVAPIKEKKNIEYVIFVKNNDNSNLISINDILNKSI